MSSPTTRDVHVLGPLDNVSIAFANDNFVANRVFPIVPVQKKSDNYFIFGKQEWFRDEIALRAPGVRAKRVDYSVTTGSYLALTYAMAHGVPDEVRKNADNPLKPTVHAIEYITNKLLLGLEQRVATIVSASANWANSASAGTQWSQTTSDPISDITTCAINALLKATGRFPNTIVMSWDVWHHLLLHPDFIERVMYTRPGGQPRPEDLANYTGVQNVIIGTAIKDSSQEGATSSTAYIWGDGCWVGYVPARPSLMEPAAGYVFEWGARTVSQYREDQEHQDVYEVQHSVDEKVTASDAGYLIINAV